MSILGGILLDNEAINRVLEILTPDDFYRESHRKIFRAMIDAERARRAVRPDHHDRPSSRRPGSWKRWAGRAYLATLVDYVPTAANIAYYCKIVKEKSHHREADHRRHRDRQPRLR